MPKILQKLISKGKASTIPSQPLNSKTVAQAG